MCQEKNNEQVMEFVSKERQSIFLATRQSDLETAISLAATHLRDDPSARKDVMNMWLRRKGAILEAQKGFQDALIYSDDPGVADTFQKPARIRGRLSQLVFGGVGDEDPEVYRKRISVSINSLFCGVVRCYFDRKIRV